MSFSIAGEGLPDQDLDPEMTRSGSKSVFLCVVKVILYADIANSCCSANRVFFCSSEQECGLCFVSPDCNFTTHLSIDKENRVCVKLSRNCALIAAEG